MGVDLPKHLLRVATHFAGMVGTQSANGAEWGGIGVGPAANAVYSATGVKPPQPDLALNIADTQCGPC
eukprot:2183569-Prorocentrum_lima.AAC.1